MHSWLRLMALGFIISTCALCALWSHSPHMSQPSGWLLIALSLPALLACALATYRLPRSRPLTALATGVLCAALRVPLALGPPPTSIPTPIHISTLVEVSSQPSPTPHGWRLELREPDAGRVFLATLPYDAIEDPHVPPLPGTSIHADLTLAPTPARQFPDELHPTTRLAMRDAHAYARVESFDTTHQPRASPHLWLAQRRLQLMKTLRTMLPEEDAALTIAMTLGVKELLPTHLKEPFSVTGTSHLLAISGLHLGTLAALLGALIKLLLSPWLRHVTSRRGMSSLTHPLMALCLLAYVVCIGAPTSAQRALMMLLMLLATHALRRRLPPVTILLWAASMLCMMDPLHTLEPAFWLSVGATFAILQAVSAQSLREHRLRGSARWRHKLGQGAHVSIAAWLGTAPIVLCLTHELPLVGIPLNMILVPAVGLIIFPLMVLGVVMTYGSPALASYPLRAATHMLRMSADLCEQAAMWPGATWRPGHIPLWLTILLAALIAGALLIHHTRPWRTLVTLCVAVCCVMSHGAWRAHAQRGSLRVDFIPVGQGDATLITFPDGETLLVDAGGRHMGRDPGAARVTPWLRHRGITQLDTMLLTHADVDHMRGMFAVVRRATPRAFIAAPDHEVHELGRLRAALNARQVPTTPPALRRTFTQAGVHVIVHTLDDTTLARNDRSIVLELHYQGASILLPGDIERPAEAILATKISSPITLIKMPHHGSHTSSTAALLEHIQPAVAVASCGLHNRFDHPRAEVLDRYKAQNIPVWRTDHHGLITATITKDGELTIAHPVQRP